MPTGREWQSAAKQAEDGLARIIADAMSAAADTYEASGQIVIPPEHRQRVSDALLAIWGQAIRDGARATIGDDKADWGLETKQDEESFFDRLVSVFAELFGGRKIELVANATREQVARIVLSAQRRGLGLPEVAQDIRDKTPIVSANRAAVIARTEAHGSSNYASYETARTAAVGRRKQWISLADPRTRDFGEGDGEPDEFNHRAMHEVTVAMDEPFKVPRADGGYDLLMYPGDPNGSPGAVINCRCGLIFVRAEQE